MTRFALFIFTLLPLLSFSQKSRVEGKLYLLPSDNNSSNNEGATPYSGLPLEIFVHAPTTNAELDEDETAITRIYTPLIARVFSKWDGTFKVKLPPGSYSVFVYYQNKYFGNLQDKNGVLSPVIVTQGKKAWVTITINYTPYH